MVVFLTSLSLHFLTRYSALPSSSQNCATFLSISRRHQFVLCEHRSCESSGKNTKKGCWALAFRHRNGFGDRVSALTVQVRVQMRSREFMSLERYSLVGGGRFPEVSTCATRADEPPHTAIHHQTDHCRSPTLRGRPFPSPEGMVPLTTPQPHRLAFCVGNSIAKHHTCTSSMETHLCRFF